MNEATLYSGQFNKEHKKVKSPKSYTSISDEDLTVMIKHGIRVISPVRNLRVLSN